jgi:hypothetical protein
MVFDCSVLAKEMNDNAPLIRSALPQYERKADFLGGWSSQHYNDWKLASVAVDQENGNYCCSSGFGLPNVANESNSNLSSAQKELLLWHWKLGISMQRIQELMRVVEVEEPDGKVSAVDRVIRWSSQRQFQRKLEPYHESNMKNAILCHWISMLSRPHIACLLVLVRNLF